MTSSLHDSTLRSSRFGAHGDPPDAEALLTPRPGSPSLREFRHVVLLLARREIDSRQRTTLLGWAWPVTRQLAQLAVLVFVFSEVLPVGIDNFAAFLFTGLIAWNWFSGGVSGGTSSLLSARHFVFQPRFPTSVLPVVPIAVQFVDLLFAAPVLLLLLISTGALHATAPLVVIPLVAQVLLMAGLAWGLSAGAVFLRDIPALVGVVMTLLFYMTPIFYGLRNVPDQYRTILELNPLTTLLEVDRALLLGSAMPPTTRVVAVGVFCALCAGIGYHVFRRLQPRLVDYL